MKRPCGFTLIELLCVMAIIAIIAAVSIPTFNSVLSGMGVSSSTGEVFSALSLARQDAITKNRLVAVYFYQYSTDILPTAYRGFQIWELALSSNSTLVPTTQVTRFTVLGGRAILAGGPNGAAGIVPNNADVLNAAQNTTVLPIPTEPAAISSQPTFGNYHYMGIIFHPDGSTSLPLTTTSSASGTVSTHYWSLTCCDSAAYNKNPGVMPADAATIQIDATSGTCQILRP